MQKHLSAVTLIILSCLAFFSTSWKPAKNGGNGNEDIAVNNKILVIPYHPSMYFCNNDQFICKASNTTPGELNKMIRNSLAYTMQSDLSEYFFVNQISEKETENGKSDVENLYSITRYREESRPLVAYYRNKQEPDAKNLWGLRPEKKEKDAQVFITNPEDPNLKKKHRYYRAEFLDSTVISRFSQNYGVQYFLFIDHFEMQTHYKDCVSQGDQASKRDLYVHYTLLDAGRNFIDGGVVCSTYESSTNDIKEIMKNNLGVISSMIISQIKPKIKA